MQSFLNVIQPQKGATLKGAIRTFANLKKANVCIIGSGPAGSLFARRMVEDGRSTIVLEAGTQKSEQPGEHLKNAYIYQRELSTFSNIISGTLQPASIPPSDPITLTDNPGVWSLPLADVEAGKGFIKNGQNPNQIPNMNLSGWGNTYGVGGMATHWTCSTPRQHPTMERYNSEVYNDKEWDRLYSMNEQLLHTTHDLTHIQGKPTLRHTLVEETIAKRFNSQLESGRHVNSLPLAATRTSDKIIHWSAPYDILKPVLGNPNFHLVKNTLARELVMEGGRIKSVKVKNLMTGEKYQIEADVFVVACNSILTPQLLWASRIRPKALGRYLCEQPMTFCQVALRQDLVDKYINDPRFKGECDQYHEKNPHDPLTIPINAPDPQVWIPVTKDRPWHAQIHRDAFSYGEVIPSVDTRLIVDLRYFGMTQPHVDRRVTFSDKVKDIMGMPQPTFHWFYDDKERKECFQMMEEMMVAANAIGGFLDGREPKFMAPGLALHVTGTVRMGKNTEDSVVDETSRVHGIDNLYLGSNGVIPTPNACNPTLTNLCFVQKASETIVKKH